MSNESSCCATTNRQRCHVGQQVLLAFPYEPATDVTEFLMVSGDEPLPDEYTLGLAMG